jgi:DNA-binding Lrp family transcriptional regulator
MARGRIAVGLSPWASRHHPGGGRRRTTAAVLKSLRGILEVQALHTTNGRWDIIVELGVESLGAFDQALQRIRLIKGVSNSETSLLLSTHKI